MGGLLSFCLQPSWSIPASASHARVCPEMREPRCRFGPSTHRTSRLPHKAQNAPERFSGAFVRSGCSADSASEPAYLTILTWIVRRDGPFAGGPAPPCSLARLQTAQLSRPKITCVCIPCAPRCAAGDDHVQYPNNALRTKELRRGPPSNPFPPTLLLLCL